MTDITLFTESANLTTLDKNQIEKIKSRLPEYHRTSAIIGHSTSQSSYSLQTMNMLDDSPLSRMKQCISQIHHKQQALQESYFKTEKMKIEIKEFSKKDDELSRLEIFERETQMNTIHISMTNALRQIGMFQDMYDSIRKNNNIPENWTEKDYEAQEIQNMIRKSFRLGIQDIQSTGQPSKAAVEYWEQLGIHPQLASTMTANYLYFVEEKLKSKEKITIKIMHDFLDKMVEEFKDSYKDALKRIGLDEIGSEEFMSNGATKPQ